MPTIDFYYVPPSPPCRSVQMLAKVLGVELDLKLINLSEKAQLKPEYIAINPQHTIPTIVDKGFTLWKSQAILCYLVDKYSKNDSLYPRDPQKRAKVDQMLFFDSEDLFTYIRGYVGPQLYHNKPADPEMIDKMKTTLEILNGFLAKRKYVAGDQLTIADFALASNVSTIECFGVDLSAYPKVASWLERMKTELPYDINQVGVEAFKQVLESLKPSA